MSGSKLIRLLPICALVGCTAVDSGDTKSAYQWCYEYLKEKQDNFSAYDGYYYQELTLTKEEKKKSYLFYLIDDPFICKYITTIEYSCSNADKIKESDIVNLSYSYMNY